MAKSFRVHYKYTRMRKNGYRHSVTESVVVEADTVDEALNDVYWWVQVNLWDHGSKNYTEIIEARELKED